MICAGPGVFRVRCFFIGNEQGLNLRREQIYPQPRHATVGLDEGVTVYQMTLKGLALQATLQGAKYWKNDDPN